MLAWRIQIDEDFPQDIAEILEQHGFLVRRPALRQLGMSDPEWLTWCFENDLVICTCNLKDFRRLNRGWRDNYRLHCGIIGLRYAENHAEMAALLLDFLRNNSPNDLVGRMVVPGYENDFED
jgi:hypothetical protein